MGLAREVDQLPHGPESGVLSQPQKTRTAAHGHLPTRTYLCHCPVFHCSEVRRLAGFDLLSGTVVTHDEQKIQDLLALHIGRCRTEVNTEARNKKIGVGVGFKTREMSYAHLGLSTQ